MGYLALYRKYRPNNFNDLVGQNSVVSIIRNEIILNKLSHAYLFSGPRGTGKTSTAKIIAKMINCENLSKDGIPCEKCDSCISFGTSSDVVEIDAASNNGVDEIRDLRDKVNLVPTSGKYKVYIIDEVHMLTTQAFNALLKTLEEPPKHAIFILATTEFYKIPATVISRCQKFQFLKFSNDEIVERLSKIAKLENIDVNNTILYEIARLSDGGLRDAINMLDQLSSFSDKININDLYKLNGVISYFELFELLKYIHSNNILKIVNFINNLDREGKSLDRFINDMLFFLKDFLLLKNDKSYFIEIKEKKDLMLELSNLYNVDQIYDIIFSLNELGNEIKNSSFSSILIITYFVRLSNKLVVNTEKNNAEFEVETEKDEIPVVDTKKDVEKLVESSELEVKRKFDINLKRIRINNSFATASKKYKDDFIIKWKNIRSLVDSEKYNSIVGILDDIEVLVVGSSNVIFMAKYESLIDRICEYIFDFESLLKDVYNILYKIVIISEEEWINEKNKYVDRIKSGYKYEYIEEINVDQDSNKVDDDVNKIISLVGEDVIVYK